MRTCIGVFKYNFVNAKVLTSFVLWYQHRCRPSLSIDYLEQTKPIRTTDDGRTGEKWLLVDGMTWQLGEEKDEEEATTKFKHRNGNEFPRVVYVFSRLVAAHSIEIHFHSVRLFLHRRLLRKRSVSLLTFLFARSEHKSRHSMATQRIIRQCFRFVPAVLAPAMLRSRAIGHICHELKWLCYFFMLRKSLYRHSVVCRLRGRSADRIVVLWTKRASIDDRPTAQNAQNQQKRFHLPFVRSHWRGRIYGAQKSMELVLVLRAQRMQTHTSDSIVRLPVPPGLAEQ